MLCLVKAVLATPGGAGALLWRLGCVTGGAGMLFPWLTLVGPSWQVEGVPGPQSLVACLGIVWCGAQ